MTTNFKKLFGERVRHYRKLNNFSQEKLAELVSMSPNTISYIENGKTNISFAKCRFFQMLLMLALINCSSMLIIILKTMLLKKLTNY